MTNNEQSQEKTKKCPKCQEDIQIGATKCKHCSADLRNWFIRHKILTGILILFIIGIIGNIGNDTSNNSNTSLSNNANQQEKITNDETKQTGTVSQKSAIKKAKSYLDMSGFSRDGLIKQLEFEKFSREDAIYALDNINTDWNKQAERKAKSYLDMSGFSRDGLIKQLEFEGFTSEQATYGVNAIGL